MKRSSKLKPGDRVYEVLIYTVRPATVTGVSRIRCEDGRRYMTVYTIKCDDGSLSPRYGENDIGNVLFTDRDEAAAKCREFRRTAAPLGAKGAYQRRSDQRHGERNLEMLYELISSRCPRSRYGILRDCGVRKHERRREY